MGVDLRYIKLVSGLCPPPPPLQVMVATTPGSDPPPHPPPPPCTQTCVWSVSVTAQALAGAVAGAVAPAGPPVGACALRGSRVIQWHTPPLPSHRLVTLLWGWGGAGTVSLWCRREGGSVAVTTDTPAEPAT